MGYFAVPSKPLEACTAQDLVETAVDSLSLFVLAGSDREHDYLVTSAISYLHDAMRKLRPLNDSESV